ncbi:hypothetical protein GCM10027569_01800 [Flindersiella endophytica]
MPPRPLAATAASQRTDTRPQRTLRPPPAATAAASQRTDTRPLAKSVAANAARDDRTGSPNVDPGYRLRLAKDTAATTSGDHGRRPSTDKRPLAKEPCGQRRP